MKASTGRDFPIVCVGGSAGGYHTAFVAATSAPSPMRSAMRSSLFHLREAGVPD